MKFQDEVLQRELVKTLGQINSQIAVTEHEATGMGISVHDIRNMDGSWVVIPLLGAKAQVLHSLVLLQDKEK